jgi:NitT/TauT family transport system substrate-binding protein
VAKEKGFFDQNGLDVELISIANGQLGTAAILASQVQFLQIAIEPIQVDLTGGADLVYIVAPQTVLTFKIFAAPTLTDAQQLKGGRVGITAIGSVTLTAAKMGLRSLGLDPEKDVQLVALNSIPNVLVGLKTGAVHAGVLSSPTTIQAREAGMRELVDVSKLGKFLTAWQATTRKYADANPDVIRRYTKSVLQAIAFEIQEPVETQRILGQYLKITDQAQLKEGYDELVPILRRVPTPDLETIKNVLDEFASSVPQAKGADPAQFIDSRWVQELEASGFIASLYK